MPKLADQAGAGLGSRLLRRLSKRDQEGGTDSKNSSASGIVFLNSIFFSELVCQFQPFPDRRSQPPFNTLWSLCCFPRPLQQVQANRVKRGQRCLHGALHPEQGREQEARQKCELRLSFQHSFIQITFKVGESGDLPSRAMERGDSAQSFASSLAR